MSEPKAATRGGFARAVIVLVSGTALAHGLTAAALPILSRLYSPAEFGLLAVFSSALAIVAVAACLRYELAIPLPQQDDEARHLLLLSIICALGIGLLMGLAVALAPDWIAARLGQPALAPYLWMLPLGVVLAGAYSALQFWYVRERRFTLIARTRIAQSASSAGTQIGLGWAGAGPVGLLLGHMLNTGIACIALGIALLRQRPRFELTRLPALARTYDRFPKYSTFEALANSAAIQLPIIMIAALVVPAEAGYLTMAMFVMQAPMSLIGGAISQVYLSRAPDSQREGRLGAFTAEVLGSLLKTGTGPLAAIGIVSPVMFGLVFGPAWTRAGWLVSWMTPWFLLQFLAVPVSMALHVAGRQRAALLLQLGGLALRVASVWLGAALLPHAVAESYAISGAVFYGLYLWLILRVVGTSGAELAAGVRAAIKPLFAWGLAATAFIALACLVTPRGAGV